MSTRKNIYHITYLNPKSIDLFKSETIGFDNFTIVSFFKIGITQSTLQKIIEVLNWYYFSTKYLLRFVLNIQITQFFWIGTLKFLDTLCCTELTSIDTPKLIDTKSFDSDNHEI